jgi:hypothetical protein
MRIFTCSSCQQMVFFENFECTKCGHPLAFIPEHLLVSSLEPADAAADGAQSSTLLVALAPGLSGARYRRCRNGVEHAACNWLIPEHESDELCRACRLNTIIPDLDRPDALPAWQKLEGAKRRLIYTLLELGLPIESRAERPENGLAFAFMADGEDGKDKVLTGHADGLITINIAEADDPFREQVRKDMGEAYRTLLGHFRHEVGHYYWDRLISNSDWIEHYRALFGDERADYGEAVKRHYEQGTPPDWKLSFVSAYATMHPWEDWAETWAHYLHMVDTLGTARAYGVSLKARPVGGAAEPAVSARKLDFEDFDDLLAGWVPLTLALNGLNRSMGFADPYPFVLSEKAILKLRFVHEVVENWNAIPRSLAHVLARWPAAEPRSASDEELADAAASAAPQSVPVDGAAAADAQVTTDPTEAPSPAAPAAATATAPAASATASATAEADQPPPSEVRTGGNARD